MDNDQAKFLLSACQPSGKDADRPEIAEALAQARHDPELADWLARERRSDAAIARQLRQLEPDPALRARLLAGGRASQRARHWRHRRARLMIAAGIAFAAGLGWWGHALIFSPSGPTPSIAANAPLREWQQNAVGIFANPQFHLDLEAATYEPLERHLVAHDAHVAGALPFTTAIVSAVGCRVLPWRGSLVSLTCFRADTGELVHLFVGSPVDLDTATLHGGPQHGQIGAFATVTWLQGDLVVMVASKLPADQLDRMLLPVQLAGAAPRASSPVS